MITILAESALERFHAGVLCFLDGSAAGKKSHSLREALVIQTFGSQWIDNLRVIAATLPKRLETEPADRPLEKLSDEVLTRTSLPKSLDQQ